MNRGSLLRGRATTVNICILKKTVRVKRDIKRLNNKKMGPFFLVYLTVLDRRSFRYMNNGLLAIRYINAQWLCG